MDYDITSPSNERIKWLVRLRDRRHRDEEGVFVIEGERIYRRALAAGLTPRVTFVSDADVDTVGESIRVAPEALDRASYRSRSQGVVAVFDHWEMGLEALEVGAEPLILVVENIEKPGNLGAMARSAAAAGIDALITVGETVDPWNPNALRSSTGAMFTLPFAVSTWDFVEPWLAERGIRIVAASPEATRSIWESDLTGSVAVVVGAEDHGLSKRAASIADEMVVIPQAGTGVDSLNASVTAAVVLFEAVRQRTGNGG